MTHFRQFTRPQLPAYQYVYGNNNSGSFTLRGTVKIKDISGIGLAAPLYGNFGRGVLELRIENSWNKVNWSPRSVSRSKY